MEYVANIKAFWKNFTKEDPIKVAEKKKKGIMSIKYNTRSSHLIIIVICNIICILSI